MVACKVIVDDNGMSGRIDSHRDLIHASLLVDHSNLGPLDVGHDLKPSGFDYLVLVFISRAARSCCNKGAFHGFRGRIDLKIKISGRHLGASIEVDPALNGKEMRNHLM